MTLHPLSGLQFLSPKLRTSTPWTLLLLGAMHLFKKSEDRHVLLNVGIDGILLLHQLMDHHLVVAIK